MSHSIGPRGEPTWPAWRQAQPGARVRAHRTGWTGTVLRVSTRHAGGSYVRVRWDQSGAEGVVVAPAYDLEELDS